MALSTYLANKLLDHAIGKTAFAMPDAFLALFTSNPTAAGSGTECSYGGYARIDITGANFTAAGSGSQANAAQLDFANKTSGTDPVVTHWATFDAATGGNMLEFGALTASATIGTGGNFKFLAGALVRTAA